MYRRVLGRALLTGLHNWKVHACLICFGFFAVASKSASFHMVAGRVDQSGRLDKARLHTLKMTIVIGETSSMHNSCPCHYLHSQSSPSLCAGRHTLSCTFFGGQINTSIAIDRMHAPLHFIFSRRTVAARINPKIQRGLFIFAVSNSCVNPVIYGEQTVKQRSSSTNRLYAYINLTINSP
jgi:hypothetical protein